MVRLYGIVIAKKNGEKIQKICEEIDVSSFGFFQRNSVGEFVKFTHTVVLGKNYYAIQIENLFRTNTTE